MRLLGLALLVLLCGSANSSPTLTAEELVRRLVGGAAEGELLELIRTHEPDFDLAPEMQDELRRAGLSERVIAAMVARQAEAHAATPTPTPAPIEPPPELAPTDDRVSFVVTLEPGPGAEPNRLRLYDVAAPELVAAAGLRAPAAPVLTDVAVVLLCRTPDHVPDHWRSVTPLGRDFVFTPRHELLAFVSGATRETAGKAHPAAGTPAPRGILTLALPARLEGRGSAGTSHDLSLGVAVELDGRFLLVVEDRWDGVAGDGPLELRAEVRSAPGGPLSARFLRDPATAPTPANAPDAGH